MDILRPDSTESTSRKWLPDWAASAMFYRLDPSTILGTSGESTDASNLSRWYELFEKLGVTAVNFGSIFEGSPSDVGVSDFFAIDHRYGDIHVFRSLIEGLHRRNIKVVLDADFLHTGPDFFAFQDVREYGKSSQYAEWYYLDWDSLNASGSGLDFSRFVDGTVAPRLNLTSPRAQKYVLEVARMWLADYGIDGWRLGAVGEAEPSFWWEFRRVCKEANSDSLLIAEVAEGDYRRFVAPDLLDAAVNLHLLAAAVDSANAGNMDALRASLERASHVEWGVYRDLSLLNVTSSGGSSVSSALIDHQNTFPLVTLMMTVPGMPCAGYYDDLEITSTLAELRRQNSALAFGSYATIDVGQSHLAYARQDSNNNNIIALNFGRNVVAVDLDVSEMKLDGDTVFENVLDPTRRKLVMRQSALIGLDLAPHSAIILVAQNTR